VLGEMLRVVKPGGLVVAAEPNNRASLLVDTDTDTDASVEEIVDMVRFYLTCDCAHGAPVACAWRLSCA